MARNRADRNRDTAIAGGADPNATETDTVTEDTPPDDPETSPGGEEGDGQAPVKDKDRARIDRAIMHLGFLEKELKGLADDKSSLAGAMRQTAAQLKNQLPTNIDQWPPVKGIRALLEKVKDRLPPDQ